MNKIIGIIPARYKSSRLPGKALLKIGDKTMIQMVYERSRRSTLLDRVIVATDDSRIYEHVISFGGESVMTAEDVPTGTDRCYLASRDLSCDLVVNIQGDEPLIEPQVIDATVNALLNSPAAVCSTPVKKSHDKNEIISAETAKVVVNKKLEALFFSRSPIPYHRNKNEKTEFCYIHIGLYVYRKDFLEKYTKMKRTRMEITESLEQLRILENGYKIQCCQVEYSAFGVDTEEDLFEMRKLIEQESKAG